MSDAPAVSLLAPPGPTPLSAPRAALSDADLGLASLVRALDYDGRHSQFIRAVLAELTTAPETIRYRQDVLADLLRLPNVVTAFVGALPQLTMLASVGRVSRWEDATPLLQAADRLGELDIYLACVERLWTALDAAGGAIGAQGLVRLRQFLATVRAQPDYSRLAVELPQLRAQLDQAGSVTLGINLDSQLRPTSATIVSVNHDRFAGTGTWLGRLLGEHTPDAVRGITALYKAEKAGRPRTPEHDLFRDLSRLLEQVATPVAQALAAYARVTSAPLAAIAPELAFYLGAVRLTHELRDLGLPLCPPTITPVDNRLFRVEDLFNLDLALQLRQAHGASLASAIVPNDVGLGPDARIALVTGPNSGGKTTYLRAIGQAQVLAQAGLLVPGRRAELSPVERIITHFPVAEGREAGGGRLEEELKRLADLFCDATPASLVLLNEPLASTDSSAARALCRDVVLGLDLLDARAVVVTHLHELVEDMLHIDGMAERMISLVAGVVPATGGAELEPSYKIRPGRPEVVGYATELARRHGLSLGQIRATLARRGVRQ